jgi:hypothetical protein
MPASVHTRMFCFPVTFLNTLKIEIYKTVMLPVSLYERGTWFFTLREGYSLMMFESRVIRRKLRFKKA